MASPFSIFRKNQRLWMAGAVLIAILAFVVAPMLQSFSGYNAAASARSAGTDVAASWAGGSISRQQIDTELDQLAIANTFLRKLAVDVRDKGGFPQVPEVRPDFAIVGISPESRDPATIVQRKLLAAEAKRLGIHFDDASVKRFLQKFVNGKLSGDQIQKTMKEVSGGRMNLMDFNRLMREELAKQAVLRVASTSQRFEERINAQGLPTTVLSPPSKNWQYFTRFNRTANVEVFPVYVKDFETKVTGTPSDRELRELFEKGKEVARIDMPIQTEPAFLTPAMADFQYIECDIEKIISDEAAKIPEDVLRAEYDRRVAQNQYRVLAPAAPTTEPGTPASTEPPATTEPGAATPPASTPAAEPAPAAEKPLPPTLENPDGGAPAADKPTASYSPDPSRNGSIETSSNAVRLVSFQDPAAPQDPAPVQQPAAEAPAASTAPPNAEPATTEPAPTQPVPTGVTIQDPATPGAAPTAPETPTGDQPQAEKPGTRVQTFEEVRDGLAREMAIGEVRRTLDRSIGEIRNEMEIYSVNRRAYERAVAEKDPTAKQPEDLNLQQLADKFGFQYNQTGFVDVRRASTLPIGRSSISRVRGMQSLQFLQLIRIPPDPYEGDNIGNTYVPLISTSAASQFIFWKIGHKAPETPSFESAKESVRNLWQVQRAADLAESKAKEIASRVGASSLAESLDDEADRKLVIRPNPFTWLNALIANFDIQLSDVEGLQPIGNDFMEKVFNANPGDTVVVPDFAKEVYYVVRVNSFAPNEDDLLVRFATAPNTTGVQNAANLESARSLPAWFSNLQKQLGYQGR